MKTAQQIRNLVEKQLHQTNQNKTLWEAIHKLVLLAQENESQALERQFDSSSTILQLDCELPSSLFPRSRKSHSKVTKEQLDRELDEYMEQGRMQLAYLKQLAQ